MNLTQTWGTLGEYYKLTRSVTRQLLHKWLKSIIARQSAATLTLVQAGR